MPQFKTCVFVSATSRDLEKYREKVRDALLNVGIHPIVQGNFPPDCKTIIEMLRGRIEKCDAMICLIGYCYGLEPKERPSGAPRQSYTQLEYEIARNELDIPVYKFFAKGKTFQKCAEKEPEDLRALQLAYRERLKQGKEVDRFRCTFTSVEDLVEQVLRIQFSSETASRPRKPKNLPFVSLESLFKGRDDFLNDLDASLADSPGRVAAVVATQAIHGLGGIGKTRLAIEFAWRHAADYTALLFVSANSPTTLDRDLAALAGPEVLNLEEQTLPEEAERKAAVLRWLEAHPGWLLILDNVDSPAAAKAVQKLLPSLRAGHAIITSRQANWAPEIVPLELGPLDEEAAVEYLLERTDTRRRIEPTDPEDARTLAGKLDGLALAIEQAAAYLNVQRCSFANYLERWNSEGAEVLAWHDESVMNYPRGVAITWNVTFRQLKPAARAMLNLLAWLAPEPIPADLLLGWPKYLENSPDPPHAKKAPPPADALANLAAYSMLRWETAGELCSVHRLVQEIARSRIPEPNRPAWIDPVLNRVNAYAVGNPTDVRAWSVWEPLAPHAATIIDHADTSGIAAPTTRLMNHLALFLAEKCLFSQAEPLMRRVVSILEQSLGKDHPNVAAALNNLATLLQDTNRLAEAKPLYRRALAIDEKSFGEEHPNVARDLNNLARLLQDTNRLAEAEPLFRRALAIWEQSFGPDNPTVASALNNLAALLQATNQLAEAEPLMRRALAIDEKSFGEEHPKVATRLNNLAGLLQDTNQLAEAEPLMRRVVSIFEQSLEKDHPNVATALNNLAGLLQATNQLAEAEPLMGRVVRTLRKFHQANGYQHPHWNAALRNYETMLAAMDLPDEQVREKLDEATGGE